MSRKPRDPAWQPVHYDAADVTALQAVARGEAKEHEQKRALDWFIRQAAGTYELSFRSDADGGDRETAFGEGRRFVGLQAVKLLSLSGGAIQKLREQETKGKQNG